MTQAEINIWVRTQAKQARQTFAAVKRDLDKITAAGFRAGEVLDGLLGASKGYTTSLGGTSAAAADLAKSLALINKSGPAASKNVMNLGVAAELAAPAMKASATSAALLTASLGPLSTVAATAAAGVGSLAKASGASVRAADRIASANKTIGSSAAATRTALTLTERDLARINQTMNTTPAAGKSLGDKFGRITSQFTEVSRASWGTEKSLDRINQSFAQSTYGAKQYSDAWNQAYRTQAKFNAEARKASPFGVAGRGAAPNLSTAGAAAATASLAGTAQNINWGPAAKALEQYRRDLGATTRAYGEMAPAAAAAEQETRSFRDRLDAAGRNAHAFNTKLYESSDALRKAGSQAQWTGRQLAVMFTAPTLLAGGLGMKWAMDYETAFIRMKKVYDGNMDDLGGSGPEFKGSKFDKFFTAVSNRFGIAREEIAEVGADLAQAGMEGAQLAKATQLTAEFSIVGDQDLKKSTTDLISVMAQYKLSADQMRGAIEMLNAISNQTPVSMADLTDGFTRTASVAKEAGVDVRHLGAFIAALVPAAGTAAVSANGLKSVFTRLMVPTKEAAGVLEQVGIDIGDPNWISKNAVERLGELSKQFEGLSQQQKFDLAKPFAGLYQINKFVALMDDMAHAQGNYNKALEATATPSKAFETYQKELKMFLDSNPQKLKQAGTIIKNSLADAIIPLVPHIVWLAQSVAKAANAFSNLSPETQKFIILAALALAAVGPLAMLIGSFGILFGSAGKALSIFGKIAAGAAFHLLGIGKATKVVGDEVVARTPFITRAWQGTMTALRGITVVGAAAVNGVWKVGMTAFALVLRVGGALGLKSFAWYQALMLRVNRATQTKLVAQTVAGQRAATAAVAAGGRAQAGAAAAGMAGTTKATKAGGRGWLGAIASVALLFPEYIWRGIKAIGPVLSRFWPKIVDGAKQILPKLGAVFSRIAPNLGRSLLAALPRIAAAGGAIAAGLTGPIGWAIAGIVTLIALFPKQIWNAVKGLGRILATPFILGFQLIGRVFGGAWDLVVQWARGVRDSVSNILMDDGIPFLAKPFVIAVQVAASALRALPGIVVAVFRGVVKVIQEAARAVYEAFSYINPFAHHSPSLVENVTNGMAIVRDEFAFSASAIEMSTKRAYRAISSMGQLTAGLRGRVEGMERNDTLTKIGEADPAANRAYLMLEAQLPGLKSQLEGVNKAVERQEAVIDDLQKQVKVADRALDGLNDTLDQLQERADAASKALDDAKAQLDAYANAPIRGMRAMSDQIFANEMAQKRLRLEIMKLEDAGESVDSLADRFAKLQGQIETLRGEREGLRLGGAGSDILSTYDKMIRDLEAQQGAAAKDKVSPIAEAQKELDRLAREGERLDLENSLKFDPLTRQIEQMVDATSELSFAEITSGIRTSQSAIAALTTEYDRANAAVARQEAVIKTAQQQRDALNDQIEREQDNLDILTKSQGDLEEAIKGVEDAMQQIVTWVDSLNRMLEENAEKAEKAKSAAEDLAEAWDNAALGDFEVGSGLENIFDDTDIDKMTEELTNQVASMFDNIDVGGAISGFFGNIGDWFKQLPGRIWGWLSGIPGAIARQIGEWAGQAGSWFAGIGASIGGWFGGLWGNHIWPFLSQLPGQISTFLINLPSELVSAGSYIVGYIAGIFFDAGRDAVNWITGIGEKIGSYFTEGGFREDVNGVTSAVHDWFYEQIDEIVRVATETIPNAGRAVGRYFTEGGFRQDVNGVTSAVHNWFYEQIDEIVRVATETIPNAGRAIADYFTRADGGFRSDLGGVWNSVFEIGRNIVEGLWNGIRDGASNAWKWIQDNVVDPVVNGFKDALGIHSPSTVFAGFGLNLIEGLWEGIKGAGSWFKDKVLDWVEDHIPGPLKWALDIHSPSGVTEEMGKNVAEGLSVGMDAQAPGVQQSAQNLADQVSNITPPALPAGMDTVFDDFISNVNDAQTAVSGLATGLGSSSDSGMAYWNTVQKVNDIMRSVPGAFAEFDTAMVNSAGLIDTGTEAGSRMHTKMLSVQDAFNQAGAAAWDSAMRQGASTEEAARAAEEASSRIRDQFIQQAIDSGVPEQAARNLADAYKLLSGDVYAKFGINLDTADTELRNWIEKDRWIEIRTRINEANAAARASWTPEQLNDNNSQAIYSGGGVPKRADGGWISGPGGPRDDKILALVSNREFVVNAKQAARYAAILEQINAGTFDASAALMSMPRFADGGAIGSLGAAMATAASGSGGLADGIGEATEQSMAVWRQYVVDMSTATKALSAQQNATFGAMGASLVTTDTATADTLLAGTAAMSAGMQSTYTAMSAAAQKSMTDMSTGVTSTAAALSKSLTDSFAASTSAVVSSSATMTDTVTGNFQSLATNLTSIFNDQIAPTLAGFDPALGAVRTWFGDTVTNVGSTWSGIKEPVAAPARFIVNDVYNDGIRGAWNRFNTFLGLEPLGEHIARFALGGPIRGAGTGTSDSILARVANGEHVITAAEVRGAGGHRAIEAARAQWKQGLPAFAKGGPVDLNAAPWGGGGGESNLKPAAILARRNIHKYWPSVGTIGGYRAQDPYPDHPSGLALDIMTGDPVGTEINDWLHREKDALALNYTIWKQWYKPAGGIGNLMEDRGSITQNHMDHVHALFNANGVAGIQDGGVGTLPMDQVVRDAINAQMDAVAAKVPQLAGGIGRWPSASVDKARAQLLEFLVPKAAAMSKATSGAGMIGNAESWRAMAIEAMKRNGFAWQNKAQVDAMLRQIMSESTGNPNAIQKVIDVNSGGNEAGGLLQIIPTTWATHRDPTLPDNRFDPWANMNAALRYYKARYGMDLTTNWGRGIGYDAGGWLMPGENQRVFNATGKPEAVLTNADWNAIYDAANNPVTAAMITAGVVDAIENVYGYTPTREAAQQAATAYQDANAAWTPVLYDAAKSQVDAAEETATAAAKTASGVEQFVAVGKAINDAVVEFGSIAQNAFTAYEAYSKGELTFEAIAPVLSGIGNLVNMIPDQKPEYVPWAGTAQKVTPEMKRQKAANDAVNLGKGLLQFAKDTIPSILGNTAAIGVAIEKLMVQNGPVIAAAIAMAPANPIGAAITLIPVILQGISTILPAVIQAITEIVPNLINAIIRFVTQFLPNSTYAYDSYEAAAKAAQENQAAIRNGASAPYFKEPTTVQQSTTNETVTINVYGVNMPNVTNGSDAGAFITNLQVLASNG